MRSLVRALGLFTVVPVPAGPELTRDSAGAALRWFPLVGAALGAVAALPVVAIDRWAPHGRLLGPVLAVAVLALLTRGLHLDGLADTADGLGSRAPAERALQIMRRSDIGPFGVVTIVLVLLSDVLALESDVESLWRPAAALAVAAATGRTAVLVAAHHRVPAARDSGFGAYVASSVSTPTLLGWALITLTAAGLLARVTHVDVVGSVVGTAVALVLCAAFLAHVVRRLGGVTGDVFGALVELGTALALVAFALTS